MLFGMATPTPGNKGKRKNGLSAYLQGLGLTAQEHADILNVQFQQLYPGYAAPYTASEPLAIQFAEADALNEKLEALFAQQLELNAQRLAASTYEEKQTIAKLYDDVVNQLQNLLIDNTQKSIDSITEASGFSDQEKLAATTALANTVNTLVDYQAASKEFQNASDVFMTTPKTAESIAAYESVAYQLNDVANVHFDAADVTNNAIVALSEKVSDLQAQEQANYNMRLAEQNAKATAVISTANNVNNKVVQQIATVTPENHVMTEIVNVADIEKLIERASSEKLTISLPMIGLGLAALLILRR